MRRPLLEDRVQLAGVVEVDVSGRRRHREIILVAENLALAGVGENNELVAEVAADGPGLRPHRDRFEAEPRECAQIGNEHLVVRMPRRVLVDIE